MRKHFTIFMAFLFFSSVSYGQTVSGIVMSDITGTLAPAVNQRVYYIFDSTATYHHAGIDFYTNTSGNYSGSLPAGIVTGAGFTPYTLDTCNFATEVGSHQIYTGPSGMYNQAFTVCLPMAPSGKITLGTSSTGAANAMVYYIKKCYNTTIAAFELTAIDSAATNVQGEYSMNTMPSSSGGCTFFLKAALKPIATNYTGYLPTYYNSSLNWSSATTVPLPNYGKKNIALTAGTNPGGPGFIGGSVLLGANKTTGVGDPLGGRILILTTQNDQPVAYTYSAVNGKFSFPNLPYGAYKIFGDAPGKNNPALTVTINAALPSISTLVFEENSSKFEGRIPTGVKNTGIAFAGLTVYPNPVQDHVYITGLDQIKGEKQLKLLRTDGVVIYSNSFTNGKEVSIDMQTYPTGLYLLRIQTAEGAAIYRIIR